MMTHTRAYIICTTPRSGSTLLCDLLTDTGLAGRPDSFFRREDMFEWANHFAVPVAKWEGEHEFDLSYLAAVRREGSGGSPIFGMRLMWESVAGLSNRLRLFFPGLENDRARFQSAFDSPLYLHLAREDKVAQAISRLKAEQTGLWHVFADGSERERIKTGHGPVYDFRSLSKQITTLEEQDAAWANWFTRQEIEPLRITYEALSSDPASQLAGVLSALGLDPAIAEIAQPRTARLADSESEEWASRFRAERIHHQPRGNRHES